MENIIKFKRKTEDKSQEVKEVIDKIFSVTSEGPDITLTISDQTNNEEDELVFDIKQATVLGIMLIAAAKAAFQDTKEKE